MEKVCGVVLKEEKISVTNERVTLSSSTYSLNSFGLVNGLSFFEKNINLTAILPFNDLEYLGLTLCSIEDISILDSKSSIKYLLLGGNNISDINSLRNCQNLKQLVLWNNPIKDFRPLSNLIHIEELYCQMTGLIDLTFIKNLPKLKILEFSDNKIEEISCFERSGLNINLENNRIKKIQRSFAKEFNWLVDSYSDGYFMKSPRIVLDGNPLEFPPASVIMLGPETTKNYYEASEEYGHEALSEGRIIFIGDGSSGKSSIIEKTLYGSFTKGREQTNGIKIEHLSLSHPEDKRNLNFHIWDFGGQEIQHAVHKFFFTEGCLYVLVLDNRKEEDPEYWLQQIESLGGKAPVLVVFNKQDENAAETVDRKYLKEKYPNIAGFYKTSCQTGFGIQDFKTDLEKEVVKLRTVDEQFPKNWLQIKKSIEELTSGSQHYLTYEVYKEICKKNNTNDENAQKLLLSYFNKIGTVTWFGEDQQLKFLHVLNPAWITQGVYKILTAKKTANLFGQISIDDFKELLQPVNKEDYTYDEKHYGYILQMMKKFSLCDVREDKHLLIPSAFGKIPKVEYSEFKGEGVRTYVLQFKDYMPLALIHRYTTKNIANALDNNYWYTGIVVKDSKSDTLAMVHADKNEKRIYVRIKGNTPMGLWEYIRREFGEIISSYAKISYEELVAVETKDETYVKYSDLVSYLQAGKGEYFHPGLKKDFNVGYLMGFFESKTGTIEKVKKGEIQVQGVESKKIKKVPNIMLNILNQNSPTINTQVNTQINVDIDIQVVNNLSSELKGDAQYLADELKQSNADLKEALLKVVAFASDAKTAQNIGDVKEKGWGRKLKNVIETLGKSGENIKHIAEGREVLSSVLTGIKNLAGELNFTELIDQAGAALSNL